MALKRSLASATKANPTPWRNKEKKVWVVLPAFNEGPNLSGLLEKIDEAMWEDNSPYEIIVVDDGSSDHTPQVVNAYSKTLPIHSLRHEINQGLGATIRDGLKYATKACSEDDIIVAMDADNSHTPHLIRSMVRGIREGNDVVIASRFQNGAYVRGVPFYRIILSYCARFFSTLLFPIPGVRDYTCGFRAYRSVVLKAAFNKYGEQFISNNGFESMLDILLKLRDMDAIFREVPLILRYDQKKGASKMHVFRTMQRSLGLLLKRKFFR